MILTDKTNPFIKEDNMSAGTSSDSFVSDSDTSPDTFVRTGKTNQFIKEDDMLVGVSSDTYVSDTLADISGTSPDTFVRTGKTNPFFKEDNMSAGISPDTLTDCSSTSPETFVSDTLTDILEETVTDDTSVEDFEHVDDLLFENAIVSEDTELVDVIDNQATYSMLKLTLKYLMT